MPTSDLPTVGNSEVGISEGNLFLKVPIDSFSEVITGSHTQFEK